MPLKPGATGVIAVPQLSSMSGSVAYSAPPHIEMRHGLKFAANYELPSAAETSSPHIEFRHTLSSATDSNSPQIPLRHRPSTASATPIMNRMRPPPASRRPIEQVSKQSERDTTRFHLQKDELGKLIEQHVSLLHSIGWPKLL